ncbi:hypothetical protein FA13DRAFT_1418715 [Coprinellus micaceus]|uniref:Uncharacterized protein n=1 Tax=Coprinellus micaceus TaxID=71717 RepID=A0A4Y7SNB8_COPMI|nr:hypothetical protein FA13DRAFT_1418715 [Coprinellus micaceus]
MTADKPKSRDAHHPKRVSCPNHRLYRNPAKLKHSPSYVQPSLFVLTAPRAIRPTPSAVQGLKNSESRNHLKTHEGSKQGRGRAQILQGLRGSSSRTKESTHSPVKQEIEHAIAGKAGLNRCAITRFMKTWRRRADLHET